MSGLHTFPDAEQIVEAVREFLQDEVMPRTEGALSFHARVAANLLATLGRELEAGPDADATYAADLAALGAGDESQLGLMIRAGDVDLETPGLREALDAATRERLLVANPRHLTGAIDDDPRSLRG
jgi:hypothetical protein